jgi:hypothetical protein
LARQFLWQAGLDFDHGTGHGVGSYLSVHEGPARISKLGTAPLKRGMILSNEPGYYRTGAYGIRIENLILVTEGRRRRRRGKAAQCVRDADAGADRHAPPDRARAADRRRDARGSTPITHACAMRAWILLAAPPAPWLIAATELLPHAAFSAGLARRRGSMLGTILIIILILLLVGALPTWPYSASWGYYPGGGLGLVLIVIILVLVALV